MNDHQGAQNGPLRSRQADSRTEDSCSEAGDTGPPGGDRRVRTKPYRPA
ncbi:Uncharacterised protein [Mycobacteroides abscessus subsp. abscessus]|nr:Uncharacterised protein [Mycobacteroides abscessus subsp. abscessus]